MFAAQVLMGLIAIGMPIVIWSAGIAKGQSALQLQELRALRIEKTKLAQAIEIVHDHAYLVSENPTQAISLESFVLSIMEGVEQQAMSEEIEIINLSVNPQEPIENTSDLDILRVDFQVRLYHTMRILSILDAIKQVADWRPMEIRRCSVLRISVNETDLHANCAIDVYYYPGVGL